MMLLKDKNKFTIEWWSCNEII